jgi:hypothetical protein
MIDLPIFSYFLGSFLPIDSVFSTQGIMVMLLAAYALAMWMFLTSAPKVHTIMVSDLAIAKQFYEGLLNLPVADVPLHYYYNYEQTLGMSAVDPLFYSTSPTTSTVPRYAGSDGLWYQIKKNTQLHIIPGASYGQYEYEASLRQRGNTLFLTNNPLEIAGGLTPDKARWGLASRFRPVAMTAAAEFSHFAPFVVGLSGEVVHNTAFDQQEILRRTGIQVDDARSYGASIRATFGSARVRDTGDWQVNLGYVWLGSDAVPDAFTGSDLVSGGTNVRGVTAGLLYGVARDTQIGLRVLSGRTISSPTLRSGLNDRYSVLTMQVDLNVRF